MPGLAAAMKLSDLGTCPTFTKQVAHTKGRGPLHPGQKPNQHGTGHHIQICGKMDLLVKFVGYSRGKRNQIVLVKWNHKGCAKERRADILRERVLLGVAAPGERMAILVTLLDEDEE